jgi:dihydroneopterin aldolase
MPHFSTKGSYLFLESISITMIIGAFDNERFIPQPVEISIALGFDHLGSIDADSLASTYDYGEAYRLIKKMAQKPYTLVEFFAQECAAALLKTIPALSRGEIIIAKPGAFVDIARVGVRLEFER